MHSATVVSPGNIPEFEQNIVFGTPDLISREANRYLFFAGDVIAPRRRQERRDLAHGGEEIFSACLWRTRHFLRRGRITPLEYGARWDIAPRVPEGTRAIAVMNHGPNNTVLEDPNIVGIPAYPGEEIGWILGFGDEALPMGIVELSPLVGAAYEDVQKEGYQDLFFPTYPDLPPTLRELQAAINSVRSVESNVKEIKEQMLSSCDLFRLYATTKVEQDHQLMRKPANDSGFVFGYSPLSETLLPQLEIPRQDQGLQTMAKLTGKITEAVLQKNSDQPDMERMFELIKANQDSLVSAMADQFGKLLAAQKEEAVKPAKTKKQE